MAKKNTNLSNFESDLKKLQDILEEMVRRELGLFAENDILVLTNKK